MKTFNAKELHFAFVEEAYHSLPPEEITFYSSSRYYSAGRIFILLHSGPTSSSTLSSTHLCIKGKLVNLTMNLNCIKMYGIIQKAK